MMLRVSLHHQKPRTPPPFKFYCPPSVVLAVASVPKQK